MVESIYSAQGMSFIPSPTPQTMMNAMRPMPNNSTSYPPPSPYYPYQTAMLMPPRAQQRPDIMMTDTCMEGSTDDVFTEVRFPILLYRICLNLHVRVHSEQYFGFKLYFCFVFYLGA